MARENVTVEFTKRSFLAILSTSPILDSFSTWLVAGSGATVALMISNLGSIVPALPPPRFGLSLGILAVSILFGFAEKWTALQISTFTNMSERLEELATPLFREHSEEEDEIEEAADASGVEVETDLDVGRVNEELSRAFPWYLRGKMIRNFRSGIADQLAAHRIFIRLYCRQGVYAVLQFAFLIIFVLLVATSVHAT